MTNSIDILHIMFRCTYVHGSQFGAWEMFNLLSSKNTTSCVCTKIKAGGPNIAGWKAYEFEIDNEKMMLFKEYLLSQNTNSVTNRNENDNPQWYAEHYHINGTLNENVVSLKVEHVNRFEQNNALPIVLSEIRKWAQENEENI